MLSKSLILEVASQFSKIERIPADKASKLLKLLDAAPVDALELLVINRVKFCHGPAATRLKAKHGYSSQQVADLRSRRS